MNRIAKKYLFVCLAVSVLLAGGCIYNQSVTASAASAPSAAKSLVVAIGQTRKIKVNENDGIIQSKAFKSTNSKIAVVKKMRGVEERINQSTENESDCCSSVPF